MKRPIIEAMHTVAYHFLMRITVGETVTLYHRSRPFPEDSRRFRQLRFEPELYRFLRVKRWKSRILTAKPWQFDMKERTAQELLFHVKQAETVHELSMLLSYLPLLFSRSPFQVFAAVFGSLADLKYTIVQRFNRPRIERLLRRTDQRRTDKT